MIEAIGQAYCGSARFDTGKWTKAGYSDVLDDADHFASHFGVRPGRHLADYMIHPVCLLSWQKLTALIILLADDHATS